MVKQNQGFKRDFNLEENPNDTLALNNLGGAGIANDLRIIQNNLRNISSIRYDSISDGFFSFPNNQFVYTNDDIVGVSTNVNVGSGTLTFGVDYYVCNSDGETRFKLSTRPSTSTLGVNTITVTGVGTTAFSFIRKDAVTQTNLVNFIEPVIQNSETQSDSDFQYFYPGDNVNSTFNKVTTNNNFSKYTIDQKYKGNKDTTTNKDINYEGSISINDPLNLNSSSSGLSNSKSPGVYIGDTRAFSSDNNPWSEDVNSLKTSSIEASVNELNFSNNIIIEGITPTSAVSVAATSFTHKLPVVINEETYYLLLSA